MSKRLALTAALLVLAAAAASAGRPKQQNFELVNPLLGPEYSHWLVGPISWMADGKEIEAFLTLASDEAAAAFVEEFWSKRDPYPLRPDNPLQEQFEERAAEAEGRYGEGGIAGWRTDRGTVYVLYGEPAEVDYEVAPDPQDPLIEIWRYEKKAEEGLDGERPERVFRFIKRGEVTRFYERLNEVERRRRWSRERAKPPRY